MNAAWPNGKTEEIVFGKNDEATPDGTESETAPAGEAQAQTAAYRAIAFVASNRGGSIPYSV